MNASIDSIRSSAQEKRRAHSDAHPMVGRLISYGDPDTANALDTRVSRDPLIAIFALVGGIAVATAWIGPDLVRSPIGERDTDLAAWTPTVSVSVGGWGMEWKFASSLLAARAHGLLCAALKGNHLRSLGDLHRLMNSSQMIPPESVDSE